jgi:DNA-binding XRE family transcriptional regulator
MFFICIIYHHPVSFCIRGETVPTKVQLARDIRLDKRLTQGEVAEAMGISQASYSAIERGEKPRGADEAIKTISRMRTRTDRTDGGSEKAGRLKD